MPKSFGKYIDPALQEKVGWGHEAVVGAIQQTVRERILCIALGKFDGKYAALALSEKRVTLLHSSSLGRVSSEDFLLDAIKSVEHKNGTMSDEIVFAGSGNALQLKFVQKSVAAGFVRAVRSAMTANALESAVTAPPLEPVATPTQQAPRSSEDIKNAIRDLVEIHQEGLITDVEFEHKKSALLAEL